MPITVLTWILYHGTINNVTPMDRLTNIATICMNNNVDVICLQEVPQANLDAAVQFGAPGPGAAVRVALNGIGGFLTNYTVLQALSENNPTGTQQMTTADGYLIIYRNAAFPGNWANFTYYNAGNFTSLAGTSLRAPVRVDLTDGGGTVHTIMTWHADTGPNADRSLQILNGLLPPAAQTGNPTTVVGDFNVRGDFSGVFGGQPNFVGWTNIVATYPVPAGVLNSGLDHILTSRPANPVLANLLNFVSDAFHYPIAGQY